MKILLAYYSRSGNTKALAMTIATRLQEAGHLVSLEPISTIEERSKWQLALPLLSTLPVLPLFLMSASFRSWWFKRYHQAEQEISPLLFPDVSHFDRVCIGGPKWLYLAYPIARYLQQVKGLHGKRIGAFATFCGPPFRVFELEMLFQPMKQRIEDKQARMIASLAISSGYHEFFFFNEVEYIFRILSRLCFGRALSTFTLDSAWGHRQVARFCSELTGEQRLIA